MTINPTLFDETTSEPTDEDELAAAVLRLQRRYGFDRLEAAVGRLKIQMAGPLPAVAVRPSDPRTSQAAAKRQRTQDLRRFSAASQCGKLLSFFVMVSAATDKQATDHVMGGYAEIARWEGCRRRCSDLRQAGYIEDSGAEVDGRIVWRPTPEGKAAHHRMQLTGWTRGGGDGSAAHA